MKIKDAISNTRALSGNAVDDNTLCRWLSELDGRLMLDFYKGSEWMSYSLPQDEDHELLVPFPWDELYVHYLEAMVYYSNGEFDRYRNSYEMFNKKELDYRQWYARNQLPITLEALARRDCTVVTEGRGSKPFWYLSAYSLAVKHGYTGTEEEWLAELVGPPGPAGGVNTFNGRTGAVMPAAGDYTAAMVRAAPGGFGWGDSIGLISADSADESYETYCAKVESVLANMPDYTARLVRAYPPMTYGYSASTLSVLYKTDDNYAGIFNVGSLDTSLCGWRMIKLRPSSTSDPVWMPFEWVNPPMNLGVEYRTVERYQGNPVYRKLIAFGALPNATAKSVAHGIDVSYHNFIAIRGMARGGDITEFPVVNNGNLAGYAYIAGSNLIVKTSINLSAYSAIFELKYWKPQT